MPVYDRDGQRIGVVERVVGELDADIFDGVLVHTHPLPGQHAFADVDQIAELRERGVVLAVGRDELHEPSDNGARRRNHAPAGTAASGETPLQARLRRAWDALTGHR